MLGFKTMLQFPTWMKQCVGVLIYNTGFYFKGFMAFVNLLSGYSKENNIDLQRFGVIIAHEPGGTSVNNVLQCSVISMTAFERIRLDISYPTVTNTEEESYSQTLRRSQLNPVRLLQTSRKRSHEDSDTAISKP
ncbi:unnamed protein product [Sphagnum balticum]